MVNGASLEPSMEYLLRWVMLGLVGASSWGCAAGLACWRSSNCRIWRSSLRISSPCWRVRPPWSPAGWAASGRAANNVANARSFFIGYLILAQDQHVLAVGDVLLLGEEMEMIGLDFLDDIGHVEADMGERAPSGHRLLALVVFDYYQLAVGLERLMDGGQHFLGVIEVMVDVQGEHDVPPGFGQFAIGLGAFDQGDVLQLLVRHPLFCRGQKGVADILRNQAAAGSDAAAQEGQHVTDSGPDIGHGH